jgi:citrate lyase subunit beta/citryl-CoA lyase
MGGEPSGRIGRADPAGVPPARSWLFVPATRPDRFAKAVTSGADRVIIDLEDAVAPAAKVAARERLAATPLPSGVPIYLRVNGVGSEWFADDLAAAAALPLAGIVLPKAESAEHVARAIAALVPAGAAVPAALAPVVPILETAAGVWNALEIARSPRVERVAFGALDFQLDTGVRGDGEELAFARSRIVLASRVAGVAPPVDAVTPDLDDERRLERDLERARLFGFGGKLCIHPYQVAAANRAFSPTPEEVAWARGLLDALGGIPEAQRGTFSFQGAMVDRPVVERARAILAAEGRGLP